MAATLKELHESTYVIMGCSARKWNCLPVYKHMLTQCFVASESVLVLTGDARIIIGTFIGHDQVQNVIMNDAHERVYSEDEDVEAVPLGLYVIRGDNVCLIGEYDATKLQDDQRIPGPLAEIRQQQY